MSCAPSDLRCEHREDVPCIDDAGPAAELGARVGGHDKRQTAYRMRVERVCGTAARSSRPTRSTSPTPAARCRPPREFVWTVQVWDEAGVASESSEPARFRTGLAGWRAQWIGRDRIHDPAMAAPSSDDDPDRLLRRVAGLPVPAPAVRRSPADVRRATLYATARGVVELELNGTRVGDAVLAPGWTDYRDADRVRGARRHRARCATARTCSARSSAPGWYAGFIGFDPLRRGNHYGARPGAAVRAPRRARGRQRRGDRQRRAAGGPRPGRSSTRTC